MGNAASIDYQDRDDLTKIESQWRKLAGHMRPPRRDWAAAVVRAATAAEIAANLSVRAEYKNRNVAVSADAINGYLKAANGLDGKMQRLIRPLFVDSAATLDQIEALYAAMSPAIKKRNGIVHGGEFCDEAPAREHIAACKAFVEGLVGIYHPNFELADPAARGIGSDSNESRP